MILLNGWVYGLIVFGALGMLLVLTKFSCLTDSRFATIFLAKEACFLREQQVMLLHVPCQLAHVDHMFNIRVWVK